MEISNFPFFALKLFYFPPVDVKLMSISLASNSFLSTLSKQKRPQPLIFLKNYGL